MRRSSSSADHPPASPGGAGAGAVLRLAGAGSGFLLFLSDYPVHAWPLQLVALGPLLWALNHRRSTFGTAAWTGAFMGLCYTVPLSLALELPPLLGGPLALYLSLLWVLFALGARYALSWRQPLGAIAVAALAVVLQWADSVLLPVWGTAQAFVRVWSAAPPAIQLVSLTGMTGLTFVIVAVQALLVVALTQPACRRLAGALAGLLLGAACLTNAVLWLTTKPVGKLRVAALGWTQRDVDSAVTLGPIQVLEQIYLPLFEQAVAQGAELVVSPEVGFWLGGVQTPLVERLQQLAAEHRVWIAAGVFRHPSDDNRILFIDPAGRLRGEHVKTHLIMLMERYRAGSGELVVLPLSGAEGAQSRLLGGMICQDDNFTDLARGYGRAGVQVVAVPTNDWQQVKDHHLESSLFRPVESRYGIVRAASNGISVIADARGEVLARQDHFSAGPGFIVADLPIYQGGSVYARYGEWLAALSAIVLVLGAARFRRR